MSRSQPRTAAPSPTRAPSSTTSRRPAPPTACPTPRRSMPGWSAATTTIVAGAARPGHLLLVRHRAGDAVPVPGDVRRSGAVPRHAARPGQPRPRPAARRGQHLLHAPPAGPLRAVDPGAGPPAGRRLRRAGVHATSRRRSAPAAAAGDRPRRRPGRRAGRLDRRRPRLLPRPRRHPPPGHAGGEGAAAARPARPRAGGDGRAQAGPARRPDQPRVGRARLRRRRDDRLRDAVAVPRADARRARDVVEPDLHRAVAPAGRPGAVRGGAARRHQPRGRPGGAVPLRVGDHRHEAAGHPGHRARRGAAAGG